MELKIIKEDETSHTDRLIKNVPDKIWDEFRRLAKLNGLTSSKMLEVLLTVVNED